MFRKHLGYREISFSIRIYTWSINISITVPKRTRFMIHFFIFLFLCFLLCSHETKQHKEKRRSKEQNPHKQHRKKKTFFSSSQHQKGTFSSFPYEKQGKQPRKEQPFVLSLDFDPLPIEPCHQSTTTTTAACWE